MVGGELDALRHAPAFAHEQRARVPHVRAHHAVLPHERHRAGRPRPALGLAQRRDAVNQRRIRRHEGAVERVGEVAAARRAVGRGGGSRLGQRARKVAHVSIQAVEQLFAQIRRARAPAVPVRHAGEEVPVGESVVPHEPRVLHVLARPVRLGDAPVVPRRGFFNATALKRRGFRERFRKHVGDVGAFLRALFTRQRSGRHRLLLLGGVVGAGDAASDGLLLRNLRRAPGLGGALAHAGHVLVLRALGRERARDEAQPDDAQGRARVPPEGGDEIALAAGGARHESGGSPVVSPPERVSRRSLRDGHEPSAR